MNSKVSIIFLLLITVLLSACDASVDLTGTDAAEQILEISSDPEEYLGKTLRMAGYYAYEDFSGIRYHYVLLDSEGDQNLGFEIRWSGDYPESGTAVSVTGILKSETVYEQAYIYIEITNLHILEPISGN